MASLVYEREIGGGGAAIFLAGEALDEFASGEAASEFPACHISYGFCLPPTFIAFDESIKKANQRTKCNMKLEVIYARNGANACDSSEINF